MYLEKIFIWNSLCTFIILAPQLPSGLKKSHGITMCIVDNQTTDRFRYSLHSRVESDTDYGQ
jgi:hypothetical protein